MIKKSRRKDYEKDIMCGFKPCGIDMQYNNGYSVCRKGNRGFQCWL